MEIENDIVHEPSILKPLLDVLLKNYKDNNVLEYGCKQYQALLSQKFNVTSVNSKDLFRPQQTYLFIIIDHQQDDDTIVTEALKKSNTIITYNYTKHLPPPEFICIDIKNVNIITSDPIMANLILNSFTVSFIR